MNHCFQVWPRNKLKMKSDTPKQLAAPNKNKKEHIQEQISGHYNFGIRVKCRESIKLTTVGFLKHSEKCHSRPTDSVDLNVLSWSNIWPKKDTLVVHKPPYSPDISPSDYFLFPEMKSYLRGCYFESADNIQKIVMD